MASRWRSSKGKCAKESTKSVYRPENAFIKPLDDRIDFHDCGQPQSSQGLPKKALHDYARSGPAKGITYGKAPSHLPNGSGCYRRNGVRP
jgi:hypothetical protein